MSSILNFGPEAHPAMVQALLGELVTACHCHFCSVCWHVTQLVLSQRVRAGALICKCLLAHADMALMEPMPCCLAEMPSVPRMEGTASVQALSLPVLFNLSLRAVHAVIELAQLLYWGTLHKV